MALCTLLANCEVSLGAGEWFTQEFCERPDFQEIYVENCLADLDPGVEELPTARVDACLAALSAVPCGAVCSDQPLEIAACDAVFGPDDDDDESPIQCRQEGECRGHGDCGNDQLCDLGQCVNAYGTMYTLTINNGVVPPRDGNGDAWDFGGGAPDLFVVVEHAGQRCRSFTARDEFEPNWFHSCELVVRRGEVFRFDLWDEDALDDDWVAAWAIEDGIPLETLQRGSIAGRSEDGRTWVQLTLWPSE